jgi:hypothetical protein
LDDVNFIKRQQWATTNYAALLYAAIVWFGQHSGSVCALSTLAIITALFAVGLLIRFQYDLGKLRGRIATANDYCFAGKEKDSLGIEARDKDPFARGWEVLLALILVCAGGAMLVLAALNH